VEAVAEAASSHHMCSSIARTLFLTLSAVLLSDLNALIATTDEGGSCDHCLATSDDSRLEAECTEKVCQVALCSTSDCGLNSNSVANFSINLMCSGNASLRLGDKSKLYPLTRGKRDADLHVRFMKQWFNGGSSLNNMCEITFVTEHTDSLNKEIVEEVLWVYRSEDCGTVTFYEPSGFLDWADHSHCDDKHSDDKRRCYISYDVRREWDKLEIGIKGLERHRYCDYP